MAERIALKPSVFSLQGTEDLPDHPALKGCRCKCGYVFFPRQYYGCEMCGSLEIEDIKLKGKGILNSFVTVHINLSSRKDLATPYIVASIVHEDNCTFTALLDVKDESSLAIGKTVYSTLHVVGTDEQGREIVDLRFSPKQTE